MAVTKRAIKQRRTRWNAGWCRLVVDFVRRELDIEVVSDVPRVLPRRRERTVALW